MHRALEFNQLYWLKMYIDFNTQKRTAAAFSFEKDFFKLMNLEKRLKIYVTR